MSKNKKSVSQIAKEAQLDVDEVLVRLWDLGFDDISDPKDIVPKRSLNRVRRLLNLATRRELKNICYWQNLFKLEEADFARLLRKLGIKVGLNARKLPSGGIRRLAAEARKRNIDPILGKPIKPPVVQKRIRPFSWQPIGRECDLRLLTEDEIKRIHFSLVDDFAGSKDAIIPAGIRDKTLLASAVFRPHTGLGKTRKYPTVETSAAALIHAIVLDHPFHNGNKRTALVSMLVFLDENGFVPTCEEGFLFKLFLQIAGHSIITGYADSHQADRETLEIAKKLSSNIRFKKAGEYNVTWRKLFQILVAWKCQIVKKSRNKCEIIRYVNYGFLRKRSLMITCHGDNKEVGRKDLKRIRSSLELDESFGIDANLFYRKVDTQVSDFINRYRKTLKKLAKF